MRPWIKYVLMASAALLALVIGTVMYEYKLDQERFRSARNQCERDCIQDSGSIETCRPGCANHPDTYGPNVRPK